MRLDTILLFTFPLVSLALTNPQRFHPRDDLRGDPEDTVKCETSKGSPMVSEITKAADELKNSKNYDLRCVQSNIFKSHCTELAKDGSSRIVLCGWGVSAGYYIWCREAAMAAKRIMDDCKNDDRVGGQYMFKHAPLIVKLVSY
jgi:hypothetical protein